MSLVDVERTVLAVCVAREPNTSDLEKLGDERVWRIYRDMIRQRLRGELQFALKRTLDCAGTERADQTFAAFMEQAPPRARFFRGIVAEFAAFAMTAWRDDAQAPASLVDVCAYESARWEVGDVDGHVATTVEEMSFDKPVVLSPTLRLLELRHAAHHEPDAAGKYTAAQTYLALHRASDADSVRTWVLNAVTFALLQELAVTGRTVSEAVRNVAQAQKRVVDERFIDGLCTVLADFIEQRLILGAP